MNFSLILADMEDFKWVLYVLAAIYFIFKSRKKKTPNQDKDYKPFDTDSTTQSKPVTFEDLLKEIQQSKVSKPEPKPVPTQLKPAYQQPKYVDYDDNLKDEEEDLEDVNYNYRNDDEIYKTYEKAKNEAFLKPSYEETGTNLEDSVIRFSHFKEYDSQTEPSPAQNIAKELRNPENMKRAIVLSEILNRRF